MALFVFTDRPDALLQVHIYLSWEICQSGPTLHSVHRLRSPVRYWTCLVTRSCIWSSFVLSGEHQIRFMWKPGLPRPLPLPEAAQKPATTYNYCMIAVLWDAFDRGVLDFMSRVSNCSASAPNLIEMTPPCTLKVLKGNNSNFGVACKRQYI